MDSDDYDQIFDSDSSDRFFIYLVRCLNIALVPPTAIYPKIMTTMETSLTMPYQTRESEFKLPGFSSISGIHCLKLTIHPTMTSTASLTAMCRIVTTGNGLLESFS